MSCPCSRTANRLEVIRTATTQFPRFNSSRETTTTGCGPNSSRSAMSISPGLIMNLPRAAPWHSVSRLSETHSVRVGLAPPAVFRRPRPRGGRKSGRSPGSSVGWANLRPHQGLASARESKSPWDSSPFAINRGMVAPPHFDSSSVFTRTPIRVVPSERRRLFSHRIRSRARQVLDSWIAFVGGSGRWRARAGP